MSKVQILPLLPVLALILAGCQPTDYSPLEPPALDAATKAEIEANWHTGFALETWKDGKHSYLDYEYALGNFSNQDILQCLRVHEWYSSSP